MNVEDFPLCCSARVINDFGGTQVSQGISTEFDVNHMVNMLEQRIEMYGEKLLVAITNSDQTSAAEALKRCGFEHSTWMEKQQHPETKLRLWWRRPTI